MYTFFRMPYCNPGNKFVQGNIAANAMAALGAAGVLKGSCR
jgi:hypothetical protein